MRIAESFAKDPCRTIESVIRATDRAPELLGLELDEYVVTPEIDRYLREILSQFIESRPGRRPDGVCAWISGWFGSGKSHFLKFLGAILGDLPLKLPSGAEVGARSYLCHKWNLPFEAHLGELTTRLVSINLLGYVSGITPGLSEIVYRGLMSDSGFADMPWVAEMERLLKRRSLLDQFRAEAEKAGHLRWDDLRSQPIVAMPVMAQALTALDPKTWPSIEQAERAIEKQAELKLDPLWLTARLREEAEALDANTGRLVVLLDEVGLYVGDKQDRYLELKAIAENLANASTFGKVWLIVTSQEAPEEKIQSIVAHREELEWLRDRFPMRYALTPENIETVVRQRLLAKTDAGRQEIEAKATPLMGALALGSSISGARRNRELFAACQPSALAQTYPFLPYHLRLATEVLGALRAHGPGGEGLTGRERTILGVAQTTLCGTSGLANAEVAKLVTLDAIFDAIVGDTRAIPSAHEAEIRELSHFGSYRGVSVQAVAKALYLLQQVPEWLPATAENLAKVLYPELGARGEDIAEGVRLGLADLVAGHYVGEREGAYRFLHPAERTFEQDVERARREEVTALKRKQLSTDILRELLADFTRHRFGDGARVLDVRLDVDGEALNPRGYVKLNVVSPFGTLPPDADEIERRRSPNERDAVWLVTEPSGELATLVERVLAMEAVLQRLAATGGEGAEFRHEREQEKERLKHTTLPSRVKDALSRGTLIAAGGSSSLRPDAWENAVRAAIDDRAQEVFFEFSAGAAVVRDDDIGRILTWHGGALPACYRELRVVEDGAIREDSPLLSKVIEEIKRRSQSHEGLKGADLSDHFDRPPYGWDERVVRLALAALFRNGSIELRSAQTTFRTATDAQAARLLTNRPTFRDVEFHPAQVLTNEQRQQAAGLVAEWFGVVREAPEEIDQVLRKNLARVAAEAETLAIRLSDLGLGGVATLKGLAKDAAEVLAMPAATSRLRAILDPDVRQRMTGSLASLKKTREWSGAGGFQRASEIQAFLAGTGADSIAASDLRTDLAAEELAAKWPAVYARYHEALGAYRSHYEKVHTDVKAGVEKAVAALAAAAGEHIHEIDQKPLTSLACNADSVQPSAPTFCCTDCRRTVSALERDALLIPQRVSALLLQVEQAGAGEDKTPSAEFRAFEHVADAARLNSVIAKLRAFGDLNFSKGGIDVEITARAAEASN